MRTLQNKLQSQINEHLYVSADSKIAYLDSEDFETIEEFKAEVKTIDKEVQALNLIEIEQIGETERRASFKINKKYLK